MKIQALIIPLLFVFTLSNSQSKYELDNTILALGSLSIDNWNTNSSLSGLNLHLATDVGKLGRISMYYNKAAVDDNSSDHLYYWQVPNIDPNSYSSNDKLSNAKKTTFELAYAYPLLKFGEYFSLKPKIGYNYWYTAINIYDATSPSTGTNPYYLVQEGGNNKFYFNNYNSGYGAMSINATHVGIVLDHLLPKDEDSDLFFAYSVYFDMFLATNPSFDKMYIYSGYTNGGTYTLHTSEISNIGWRLGFDLRAPASKAINFFALYEFGSRPGVRGFGDNLGSFMNLEMGAALDIHRAIDLFK